MSLPTAQPLYFGPVDRPLFGWLHRPPANLNRGAGIVLCSPSGYEAICTHRTYRHFAEAAASRGFTALRFDYDGTGNSAGDAMDPDRVAAWLRSVNLAIDALKEFAGVAEVCLFGVRVGASLGVVAAQDRSDVRAMIAFAPVIKVKTYLREIRALALARPQVEPPAGTPADPTLQEAAGFATTEETRSALGNINLLQLVSPAIRDVMVFDRDDLPVDDAWHRHLSAHGATIQQIKLDQYVDMMRDAHQSTVPAASIKAALDWLTSLYAEPVAGNRPETRVTPLDSVVIPSAGSGAAAVPIRETPLFFDEQHPLFGVVSEPAEPLQDPRSRGNVLILLNSGTIHHIGPSRLYVATARLGAALGMPVLRMDLSGVGESPPRPGEKENTAYSASALDDIARAIRFAAARFSNANIHLIGVCSGAYHGLKAAVRGLPVRSVVVINPLAFFWKEGMSLDYADFHVTSEANRYRKTALHLSSWLKVLRGQVDFAAAGRIFTKRLNSVVTNSLREVGRALHVPLREDLASELKRVAASKIDLLFVFSSSDPGLSLLKEQGGRTVERLSRQDALRISMIDGADHTFTAHWTRDQLIMVLMAHLDRYAATASQRGKQTH